jgi:hypothetical protein
LGCLGHDRSLALDSKEHVIAFFTFEDVTDRLENSDLNLQHSAFGGVLSGFRRNNPRIEGFSLWAGVNQRTP